MANEYPFSTTNYGNVYDPGTKPSVTNNASTASSTYNPYQTYTPPAPVTGSATIASGSANSAPSGNAMQNAETGWQNAFYQNQNIANNMYGNAAPLYAQSLSNENSINYSPYLNASNTAGADMTMLSGTAGNQMNMYGNQAAAAGNQQNMLNQASNQMYQQAFDPNNAQFNQSQTQLQNQIDAGQAMRGLGNSGQGAQEYNQGMQNFDIGWNTQKLQNEQIGMQGMAQGSNAAANQGQLMNMMNQGQLNAGTDRAQYLQQGASLPIQAQQYAYSQPAQNASQYTQNMGGLSDAYGNITASALPYMNQGQGALMQNSNFGANQTASELGMLGSLANFATNPNTASTVGSVGNWLGNLGGASTVSNVAPAGMSAADAAAAGYSGSDAAFSAAADAATTDAAVSGAADAAASGGFWDTVGSAALDFLAF